MRYVPTHCLREGMVLGHNLYNNIGELMLSSGMTLSSDYLKSIQRLKYNGIYIDDDISKDIPILNLINDKVKAQTVKGIRDIFIHSEKSKTNMKKAMQNAKEQVETIVDQIFSHKNIMVNIIDMKVFDDYTYYHSVNVAVLSIVIGAALEIDREELCDLGFAALLHDIGKVFVDKNVLNKPGKLDNDEFEEIKKHPLLGAEHIKNGYSVSSRSYMGILDHHEKFEGGGYPNNMGGERISLYGRIIAVADVYDALTSDRTYRKALLPSEAMEYVMASTMTLFDPKIVEIFARKVAPYPIGTCVKLSNGLMCIIIDNYEDLCMRPKVRIYKDKDKDVNPYEIDLADYNNLNITVVEVL